MPSTLLRAVRLAAIVGLFCHPGFAAAAASYLFVFGDSLADTGNNAIVFDTIVAPPGTPPGTLRTATPIAAPTFIPTFPYASNRYSDGPVWVEQLAATLGVLAQPSLAGGTNFAFGGARVGPGGSMFPFSLTDQVEMFLNATRGRAPADALYVVAGGGNDARDAFALAASGGDPASLVTGYANSIGALVTRLDQAGAKKILLANVPDIGKTPAVTALGPAASALGSAIAAAMNAALGAELADLPGDVLANLRLFDVFGLMNSVIADPSAFGLLDVTSACAFDAACIADPSRTLFWDGIHPTTAAHSILARAARVAIPEPSVLVQLALGLALLIAFTRRKARTARALRQSPQHLGDQRSRTMTRIAYCFPTSRNAL